MRSQFRGFLFLALLVILLGCAPRFIKWPSVSAQISQKQLELGSRPDPARRVRLESVDQGVAIYMEKIPETSGGGPLTAGSSLIAGPQLKLWPMGGLRRWRGRGSGLGGEWRGNLRGRLGHWP